MNFIKQKYENPHWKTGRIQKEVPFEAVNKNRRIAYCQFHPILRRSF